MSSYKLVFVALFLFAVANTGVVVYVVLLNGISPPNSIGSLGSDLAPLSKGISPGWLEALSPIFAPFGWVLLGIWAWKGRMRSSWTKYGFDYDIFKLLIRMKGGSNRLRLLKDLESPKDRMHLARDLGVDWKVVDRNITILENLGFVEQVLIFGNIKLFRLTELGTLLVRLINDLENEKLEDAHFLKMGSGL